MIATALLISILGGPAIQIQPVLDCPLAADIAEAALTRTIYLGGVFEETSNVVEKVTLATEIDALDQLREQMAVWRESYCYEGEIK